jgi:hypothetical protein
VKEANTVYVFAPTKAQLFNQFISPTNSSALRSAAEKGKLVLALPQTRELPWSQKSRVPAGAKVITDSKGSLIDTGASEAVSDTGELRRNRQQGVYTINTAKTQAMGWIGGQRRVVALPQTQELPWSQTSRVHVGANVITDPKQSLIDVGASEAASDTGELRRNWEQGVYTIDTPKTQAAMGWIRGQQISLADVEISSTTMQQSPFKASTTKASACRDR